MIKESILKIIDGQDLDRIEAENVMNEIMSGKLTGAQIAAVLTSLRMKGESVDEITSFVSVMKKHCHEINPKISGPLVDTCGTGGDKIKTFNVSTIAAFVAAGSGISIAKHGNRSVTSRCGSADVLEALGFNLKMPPEKVEKSIEKHGIGFMFAPSFHPAMKYAIGPRREIGIRTIFNVLGPLSNPANAKVQLVGVYEGKLTEKLAQVLSNLDVNKAMVVHGIDGLDEISTIGKTKISLLNDGKISTSYIAPKDIGVNMSRIEDLAGSNPEESALTTFKILNDFKNHKSKRNPKKDIVLVNAAATIFLGGKADSIKEGLEVARVSIQSGSAYEKLRSLIKFSDGEISKLEEMENA
ncbi:MAG: anthranilate phosphoribosyltransferase [Candidatus Bathyarchaeota archaeon]|nr:anthranilate phosphoribosyltransferase [Candidatus Bathyarchaeota archaeon]